MSQDDAVQKKQFEILFREYFTGLTLFARKYTGDTDSAKEIVHSVFIRIWENRSSFEWDKPAKSYLFTSVYNRSLNFVRDNKRFVRQDDIPVQASLAGEGAFDHVLETTELEHRIEIALDKLPPKCREIFELSRFSNKKYTEIAAQLGISVKTVETQMSRALHVLKAELKDYLTVIILILLKNMNNW